MAAAVGEAAMVKQAAVQCVSILALAIARGKHRPAVVHCIIDAINSRQGRCKRNGRSCPSRAEVLSTGSNTARRPLYVWEEGTTRRIFAKKTVHIIRTHIFPLWFVGPESSVSFLRGRVIYDSNTPEIYTKPHFYSGPKNSPMWLGPGRSHPISRQIWISLWRRTAEWD